MLTDPTLSRVHVLVAWVSSRGVGEAGVGEEVLGGLVGAVLFLGAFARGWLLLWLLLLAQFCEALLLQVCCTAEVVLRVIFKAESEIQ
jgi:hypothetical protein